MDYENIVVSRESRIATVTLNRPHRLNAISKTMITELQHASRLLEEDSEVRVVIVCGAGKAFSSGFDLQDQAADPPRWSRSLETCFAAGF